MWRSLFFFFSAFRFSRDQKTVLDSTRRIKNEIFYRASLKRATLKATKYKI